MTRCARYAATAPCLQFDKPLPSIRDLITCHGASPSVDGIPCHLRLFTCTSTASSCAVSQQLFIKTKDGAEFNGWCWPGDSAYLDFTSPQVREWWAERFSYDVYKGAYLKPRFPGSCARAIQVPQT
eukprot:scaffold186571_cov28-Tisochrysis_lutea.AAC.3